MDNIIDTIVIGYKAAEHFSICSIHNRFNFQCCDIALPNIYLISLSFIFSKSVISLLLYSDKKRPEHREILGPLSQRGVSFTIRGTFQIGSRKI